MTTDATSVRPDTGNLAFEVDLDDSYYPAIDRVLAALAAEGFGAVTRIDLDKVFKEKLGIDHRRYVILGACNPRLALRALTADSSVGLLLPCNVTVEPRQGGGSRVRILDPGAMLGPALADEADEDLVSVAEEARAALGRVAEALGSETGA